MITEATSLGRLHCEKMCCWDPAGKKLIHDIGKRIEESIQEKKDLQVTSSKSLALPYILAMQPEYLAHWVDAYMSSKFDVGRQILLL